MKNSQEMIKHMDVMQKSMLKMHEHMHNIVDAKTPQERERLMQGIKDDGELIYKVIDPKFGDINIMKNKECARAGRSLSSNTRNITARV